MCLPKRVRSNYCIINTTRFLLTYAIFLVPQLVIFLTSYFSDFLLIICQQTRKSEDKPTWVFLSGASKNAPGKRAPGKKAPGIKAPEKIAPRKITPQKYAPRKIAPRKNTPQENCLPGKYPPKNCFIIFLLLLTLS